MLFPKKQKINVHFAQYFTPQPPQRIWLKVLIFFFIILIVSGFFLVPLGYHGWKIYLRLSVINNKSDEIIKDAISKNFVVLSKDLEEVKYNLSLVRSDLGKIGPILWLPQVAKSYRAIDQMLKTVINLLDGYQEMILVFTDMQKSLHEGDLAVNFTSAEGKKRVLELIIRNRSNLESAKIKIDRAKKEFNLVNVNDLTGVWKTKIVKANNLLGEIIEQSEVGLPIFKYLPELVGYNQDCSYLILFQNNMELRATGGFIGSYGLFTIRDGSIKSFITDDIYNLDKFSKDKLNLPAPWPITKYMSQKNLFMRDANWSPDWPTSAKQLEWFWDVERENAGLPPQKLDGIIAITPDFIANFLSITGPITVDGVTFTSENFALELERQVEFDYDDKGLEVHQRKKIIGDLTQEIINRLEKSSPLELLKVWSVMKKNKDEKQILVWFKNQDLQRYFSEQNWTGEVRYTDSDYLMIIDSNLAALKTDQVIKRELNYFLNTDANNNLVARVEINYHHAGKPVKYLITKYRSYTRIYLPEDTKIMKVFLKEGNSQQELTLGKEVNLSKELGKTVAGVFWEIDPLHSKTLILEYHLSPKVNQLYHQGKYSLLLQKQPGISGHKLRIDLRFAKNIIAYYADFLPVKFLGRNLLFENYLSQDREFIVKF